MPSPTAKHIINKKPQFTYRKYDGFIYLEDNKKVCVYTIVIMEEKKKWLVLVFNFV